MTGKPTKAQADEARRCAATVTRITGEWWCQNGAHYTRAPKAPATGRSICVPCKKRIGDRIKQARR